MTSKTLNIFFLLVFLSAASLADQVRLREQRFELKSSSSSASAARSYQSFTKKELEKSMGDREKGTLRSPCEFDDLTHLPLPSLSHGDFWDRENEKSYAIQKFQCYVTNGGMRYLPPFPTALRHRILSLPGTGNVIDREWVPISEVYDGPEILKRWQQLAQLGAPFDCVGPVCHLIVQGVSENESESYYAVCQVTKVKTVVGAPERCSQIAIVAKEQIWLEAITGSHLSMPSMGRPDFTFRVHGTPPKYKLPSNDLVLLELQKIFQRTRIALISELYGENTLIANASYRVSPILPGWREIVTVRVDLQKNAWSEPAFLGVTISTTFYVNRQNTDRPQDWQLPSEQQATQYLSEIRDRMKEVLQALCIQTNWRNPDDLVCEVTA